MATAPARRIDYVALDELTPATRNPKRHDLPAIGRSIDTFGYVEPLVVDERTGRLVAGHGRLEQLGVQAAGGGSAPDGVKVGADGRWHVPVVRGWSSVSDEQAAAYLAASNRLVELGGWDDSELAALLGEVAAADADLARAAGFDDAELARLLAVAQGKPEARTDPDDAPAAPAVPVSTPGDVWLLGPHRVVCGDSTDPATYTALLGDATADMLWTDPPYGVDYQGRLDDSPVDRQPDAYAARRRKDGLKVANDSLGEEGTRQLVAAALSAVPLKVGGSFYVCAPPGDMEMAFRLGLIDAGLPMRHSIVWVKDQFTFGRSDYHYRHESILYGWKAGGPHYFVDDRTQDSVWEVPRPRRSKEHPTMKPVALVEKAVANSTQPGGVVLDPFGGSGSTLIACHTLGRHARLTELDPTYVDVICHRYQAHTGTLPILESTGAPHDFTAG